MSLASSKAYAVVKFARLVVRFATLVARGAIEARSLARVFFSCEVAFLARLSR